MSAIVGVRVLRVRGVAAARAAAPTAAILRCDGQGCFLAFERVTDALGHRSGQVQRERCLPRWIK